MSTSKDVNMEYMYPSQIVNFGKMQKRKSNV